MTLFNDPKLKNYLFKKSNITNSNSNVLNTHIFITLKSVTKTLVNIF